MGIKPYLQLTRAHTVPLEAIPAGAGAALAVGGVFNWSVLAWLIAGTLYHLTGYGMNSVTDWEGGFDKNDPHKQHHPLNTGDLSLEKAKLTIKTLFIITAGYVVLISASEPIAWVICAAGVGFGVAYNKIGKRTVLKPVLISIAHTSLFVTAYVGAGGQATIASITASVFVFIWVLFQISVSGELKDLLVEDEYNLLRENSLVRIIDAGDRKEVSPSGGLRFIVMCLSMSKVFMATVMYLLLGGGLYSEGALMLVSTSILAGVYSMKLIRYGAYKRKERVRFMSIVEMMTLGVFIYSLTPVLGAYGSSMLFSLSIGWVLLFNKIQWDSLVAPDV